MALLTLKGIPSSQCNMLSRCRSCVCTCRKMNPFPVIPPNSPVENGQLPDPANWGVADVVNYFKATGFEEQATAFQDQVGVLSLLTFPVAR